MTDDGARRAPSPAAGGHARRTNRRRTRAATSTGTTMPGTGTPTRHRCRPSLGPDATTRVIGVSSGKGGVGKSTVTVNLAIALAQAGDSVGLLDADVYGFSVPKMLGTDHDPIIIGDIVIPTSAHGVKCLSMGYFVPDDQPVIWRGPMLHKAIQQFLTDAYWGEPDFVLVDMPPGTGDVALTLAEVMPRAEIVVVTTPQAAAQRVAQRSAFAARRLKLSVRGVDREHELVHRRRRHPLRALRLGRGRHPGRRSRGAAPRAGAAGQRRPARRGRGPAGRWPSIPRARRPSRSGPSRRSWPRSARPGSTGGSSPCAESAQASAHPACNREARVVLRLHLALATSRALLR